MGVGGGRLVDVCMGALMGDCWVAIAVGLMGELLGLCMGAFSI